MRTAVCSRGARGDGSARAMRCEGAECSAKADGVQCVVSEGVSPVVHAEGDRAALHAPARDSPLHVAYPVALLSPLRRPRGGPSRSSSSPSSRMCRQSSTASPAKSAGCMQRSRCSASERRSRCCCCRTSLSRCDPASRGARRGQGGWGESGARGARVGKARDVKRRPMWGWSRGECRRGTWARLGRPIRNCPLRAVPQASISRDELVAFVNTLNKFSSAIAHVKELTQARISRAHSATRERRRHTRQRLHSLLSGPPLVLRVNGATCFREPVVATDEPGCPPCSLNPDHPLPASRSSSTTATSCVAPQRCRRCSEAPLPREAVPRARERPQPRWRLSGYPRPPAPRRPPPPPDHHWAPVRASAATIGLALHQ